MSTKRRELSQCQRTMSESYFAVAAQHNYWLEIVLALRRTDCAAILAIASS